MAIRLYQFIGLLVTDCMFFYAGIKDSLSLNVIVNPSLILSGDEKGFIVCWNLDKQKTQRYDPDGTSQLSLSCLTCSPHDDNIVAVGYKSGAVSLMDINKNGNVWLNS